MSSVYCLPCVLTSGAMLRSSPCTYPLVCICAVVTLFLMTLWAGWPRSGRGIGGSGDLLEAVASAGRSRGWI